MKRATAAVGLVATVLAGCGSASPGSTAVAGGCGATRLHRGPVPRWTTAADPPELTPFAVGPRGMAAAFIFGYPLRAGTPTKRRNKILWILRRPGSELTIRATPRGVATPVVTVKLGDSAGPEVYPSYVNVPRGGCWHISLDWAGATDSVDLAYRK